MTMSAESTCNVLLMPANKVQSVMDKSKEGQEICLKKTLGCPKEDIKISFCHA